MSAARAWPFAVAAVLAITVIANVAVFYVASAPDSATVEPDYYAKALAWDSTLVARNASRDLGWRATLDLVTVGGGEAEVHVRLSDARGLPVEGALVRIEAIHNRLASRPVRLEATPAADAGPGAYRARARFDAPGMWELRVEARRGAELFVADERRELGVAP